MTLKNILPLLICCCVGIHAAAQDSSGGRSVRLIPIDGGFRVVDPGNPAAPADTFYVPAPKRDAKGNMVYCRDTLSTNTLLNKKLYYVSARFHQVKDTVLASAGSGIPGDFLSGYLKNSFSESNGVRIYYFIRSNKYGGSHSRIIDRTRQMLRSVYPVEVWKRDSIVNSEYQRYIASLLSKNETPGDGCFPPEEAMIDPGYDKSILHADSVAVIQSVWRGYDCAAGLYKNVLMFRKDIGYIVIRYRFNDLNRKTSFAEASGLLNEAIKQTWGMIGFDKDTKFTP